MPLHSCALYPVTERALRARHMLSVVPGEEPQHGGIACRQCMPGVPPAHHRAVVVQRSIAPIVHPMRNAPNAHARASAGTASAVWLAAVARQCGSGLVRAWGVVPAVRGAVAAGHLPATPAPTLWSRRVSAGIAQRVPHLLDDGIRDRVVAQ